MSSFGTPVFGQIRSQGILTELGSDGHTKMCWTEFVEFFRQSGGREEYPPFFYAFFGKVFVKNKSTKVLGSSILGSICFFWCFLRLRASNLGDASMHAWNR